MKSPTNQFANSCLSLLLAFTFAASAHAQGVAVEEADPNSANQGTVNLDVRIKGRGFKAGADVAFFVTNSTNPGGIVVRGVTVHDGKNLTANIDVELDAEIDDFDIEVILLNGRRGRGTTLFSVKKFGEVQTVYTAEVSGGAFAFSPVDVTLDHVDNLVRTSEIPPSDKLVLVRPEDAAGQAVWDSVFLLCEFLGPTGGLVDRFEVLDANWSIRQPGGVRVLFGGIPFDSGGNPMSYGIDGNVDGDQHGRVSVQLIGDTIFDAPDGTGYLPTGTDTNAFTMKQISILGRTVKGVHPKRGCVRGGSAPLTDFPIGAESTLKIWIKTN